LQVTYPIFYVFMLFWVVQKSNILRKVVKKDTLCKKSILFLVKIGFWKEVLQQIVGMGFWILRFN